MNLMPVLSPNGSGPEDASKAEATSAARKLLLQLWKIPTPARQNPGKFPGNAKRRRSFDPQLGPGLIPRKDTIKVSSGSVPLVTKPSERAVSHNLVPG